MITEIEARKFISKANNYRTIIVGFARYLAACGHHELAKMLIHEVKYSDAVIEKDFGGVIQLSAKGGE